MKHTLIEVPRDPAERAARLDEYVAQGLITEVEAKRVYNLSEADLLKECPKPVPVGEG